jgi:hypothetical protein
LHHSPMFIIGSHCPWAHLAAPFVDPFLILFKSLLISTLLFNLLARETRGYH